MSKKLEKSELEYTQELLNDETKYLLEIGRSYYNKIMLEKQLESGVAGVTQSKADFSKNIKKLEDKYGKVNIDLSDGSIKEIEKDEQNNK